MIINQKIKRFPPLVIKVKDLIVSNEKEKEEIWTLSNQSFISLTYKLSEIKNPDVGISIDYEKQGNNMKTPNKKNNFLTFFSNSKSPYINESTSNSNNNNKKTIEKKEENSSPKSQKRGKGFFANIFSSSHKTPSKVQIQQEPNQLPSFQSSSPSTSVSPSQSYEIIEGNSNINLFSGEKNKNKNFIEAVFISGLSKETTSLIPGTTEFPGLCGHEECAALHSMKSSMLQVHKSNDEIINDQFTSFSFPLGIKLCYKCIFNDSAKKIENIPKPYKIFFNVINDGEGDKKYLVSYHYFKKISAKQFENEYKINPIKEHTILLNQNEDGKFTDEKIQKDFSIISNFILNDNVLIPESVSLLSKYPYLEQMEVCLKNIMAVSREETPQIIAHLVNEIYLPQMINTHIIFYLPRSSTPIKLISPIENKTLSPNENKLSDINFCILFKYFSLTKIIKIFSLILLESKVLFICNEYRTLSELSYIFINLIWPIKWDGTFIPVLSLATYQFLQSLFPFVMGIDEYLLKSALENKIINPSKSEISYVYIENEKKSIFNQNVPELPSKVFDYLHSELKKIKAENERKTSNTQILNEKMRNAFLQVIIMFIGEYKRFVYYSDNDEIPYFDKEGYINMFKTDSNKDTQFSKFVSEIVLSQNFNQFLLEAKNNYFDENEYFNREIEKSLEQIKTSSSLTKSKFRSSSAARASSLTKGPNRSSMRNTMGKGSEYRNHVPKNPFALGQEILSQTKNDIFSLLSPNSSLHSEINYSMNRVTVNGVIPSLNVNNQNIRKITDEKGKQYLLSPFFIHTSIDKTKIEEYIKKVLNHKNYSDVLSDEEHCYIIPSSSKKFDLSNVPTTNKRYIIPNKDFSNETNNKEIGQFSLEDDSVEEVLCDQDKKNVSDLFLLLFIKKTYNYELTEREKEKERKKKERIKETYSTCFTESPETLKFKWYFGNFLIYRNQLYLEKHFKLISSETFNKLYYITKNSLMTKLFYTESLEKQEKYLVYYKLYTIVAFSYYKVMQDKSKKGTLSSYFIYEELNLNNIRCDVWVNEKFWQFFVIDEKKKQPEEDPFEVTRNVCNIMKKLKLSITFLKKTLLGDFGIKILLSEEKYESLEKLIMSDC